MKTITCHEIKKRRDEGEGFERREIDLGFQKLDVKK